MPKAVAIARLRREPEPSLHQRTYTATSRETAPMWSRTSDPSQTKTLRTTGLPRVTRTPSPGKTVAESPSRPRNELGSSRTSYSGFLVGATSRFSFCSCVARLWRRRRRLLQGLRSGQGLWRFMYCPEPNLYTIGRLCLQQVAFVRVSRALRPNPSIERTRTGRALQALISFWALRALPARGAHVKR